MLMMMMIIIILIIIIIIIIIIINVVNNEYEHFAISGMDNASSSDILRGRSFGGICFLWRK